MTALDMKAFAKTFFTALIVYSAAVKLLALLMGIA